MNKTASPLKIAAILAAAAALVLMIFTVSRLAGSPARGAFPEQGDPAGTKWRPDLTEETLELDGVTYARRRRVESYLILGVDRTEAQIRSGSNPGQADLLLLLVLDAADSSFRVLPLNRDTMTQVIVLSPDGSMSNGRFEPICLSHSYGTGGLDSCLNTVRSVEYLLSGAEIDGVIALDLQSIGLLNDAVGGITVTIDKDLTGAHPSFTPGARVTLDAETAEAYVRARVLVGEDDNLSRMDRQMDYMNAWVKKARGLGEKQLMALLEQIEAICVTDLTEKRLSSIADSVQKYENRGFLFLDGEYVQGIAFNEFHADPVGVRDMVLELYYAAE